MKKEIEKQKSELYASLKAELLEEMRKDIISHVKKSHLELKDDMTQYLKDEISSNKVELVAIKVNFEKRTRSSGKMHLYSESQCHEGNANMGRHGQRCQSSS